MYFKESVNLAKGSIKVLTKNTKTLHLVPIIITCLNIIKTSTCNRSKLVLLTNKKIAKTTCTATAQAHFTDTPNIIIIPSLKLSYR